MYLTPTHNHWILDVETDDLRDACTQIFVVCVENAITDEAHHFTDKDKFNEWLSERRGHYFVAHNGIAFDIPVLNKFWDSAIGISRVVDTFVLSMLYSPSLAGGHSLEAWGKRVNVPKSEHKDFSQYTPEMLSYCQQDVRVTKQVYLRLAARMREVGFTEKGPELEHLSCHITQTRRLKTVFQTELTHVCKHDCFTCG